MIANSPAHREPAPGALIVVPLDAACVRAGKREEGVSVRKVSKYAGSGEPCTLGTLRLRNRLCGERRRAQEHAVTAIDIEETILTGNRTYPMSQEGSPPGETAYQKMKVGPFVLAAGPELVWSV